MLTVQNKITIDMIRAVRAEMRLDSDPEALAMLVSGLIMGSVIAHPELECVNSSVYPAGTEEAKQSVVCDVLAFTLSRTLADTPMFKDVSALELHELVAEIVVNTHRNMNQLYRQKQRLNRQFVQAPVANERPC